MDVHLVWTELVPSAHYNAWIPNLCMFGPKVRFELEQNNLQSFEIWLNERLFQQLPVQFVYPLNQCQFAQRSCP